MASIASDNSPTSVPAGVSGWSRLPAAYAIPLKAPSIAEAQEYCRRLARSHYENFSVASWFLPHRLRQHFFNVYAYCRISDDLGDEVGDTALFLFSDLSRGVTGEVIYVDAGYHIVGM